jgi:SEC-C motif
MANRTFGLADLMEGTLSEKWKLYYGRLPQFLERVGLVEGQHSQCLYILPVYRCDAEEYLQKLRNPQLDNNAEWAKMFANRGPGKAPISLAFPVSRGLRITDKSRDVQQTLRNTFLALFIEVHSRSVTWWLVNAWRAKQLARATWQLADAMQIIPAAACARSLIETAAALWADTKRLREVWSETKVDYAANGPNIKHRDDLMGEINKMLWGSKFDSEVPELQRTYGRLTRTNVLTQIKKLARATDHPLQRDYQWLCNAVHPSIGGMLAFAAPMMGHNTKTHAFQWVCEAPTSFRTISLNRNKHHMLADTVTLMKEKDFVASVASSADTKFRETTIHAAIAGAATLAVEVIEQTLDDALKLVDDIGLTTKAPMMASFDYWRKLARGRGNAMCPCRSGRKAKHCLHRWTDPTPGIVERFDISSSSSVS